MLDHVLAGRTLSGKPNHHAPISFTNDHDARLAAIDVIQLLISHLNNDIPFTDWTPLAAKVLVHLTKTGTQTQEAIHAFFLNDVLRVADAVRLDPTRLTSRMTIAGMLRALDQHMATLDARAKTLVPAPVPRPIHWESSSYALTELTHPLHLLHESDALHHCVGRYYFSRPPIGLPRTDPRSLAQLFYWHSMERKATRLFSLTHNGTPRITIQYMTDSSSIHMMRGPCNKRVTPEPHHLFRALCQALHALRWIIPIADIRELPKPPIANFSTEHTTYLWMCDGTLVTNPTRDHLPYALDGHIIVDIEKDLGLFGEICRRAPLVHATPIAPNDQIPMLSLSLHDNRPVIGPPKSRRLS